MEFVVNTGIVKPEDSDLNMSPEGRMRRQLMNQHDEACRMVKTEVKPYKSHFWDKSMNTKINAASQRRTSKILVEYGMHR
jgi:hypothetical protein